MSESITELIHLVTFKIGLVGVQLQGLVNGKDENIDIEVNIMGDPKRTREEFEAHVAKMLEEKMAHLAKDLGEEFKIVVWWKAGGQITDDYACGDTPEEVVNDMRSRCWIEEENKDSQKYMSGVQSRNIDTDDFLFYDEESFLQGLVKVGALHIQKWDWEPEYDSQN